MSSADESLVITPREKLRQVPEAINGKRQQRGAAIETDETRIPSDD